MALPGARGLLNDIRGSKILNVSDRQKYSPPQKFQSIATEVANVQQVVSMLTNKMSSPNNTYEASMLYNRGTRKKYGFSYDTEQTKKAFESAKQNGYVYVDTEYFTFPNQFGQAYKEAFQVALIDANQNVTSAYIKPQKSTLDHLTGIVRHYKDTGSYNNFEFFIRQMAEIGVKNAGAQNLDEADQALAGLNWIAENGMSRTQASKTLRQAVGKNTVVVGHNIVEADLPILQRLGIVKKQNQVLDTYELAKAYDQNHGFGGALSFLVDKFGGKVEGPVTNPNKLETVAGFLGENYIHDAESDIRFGRNVTDKWLDGTDINQLFPFQKSAPSKLVQVRNSFNKNVLPISFSSSTIQGNYVTQLRNGIFFVGDQANYDEDLKTSWIKEGAIYNHNIEEIALSKNEVKQLRKIYPDINENIYGLKLTPATNDGVENKSYNLFFNSKEHLDQFFQENIGLYTNEHYMTSTSKYKEHQDSLVRYVRKRQYSDMQIARDISRKKTVGFKDINQIYNKRKNIDLSKQSYQNSAYRNIVGTQTYLNNVYGELFDAFENSASGMSYEQRKIAWEYAAREYDQELAKNSAYVKAINLTKEEQNNVRYLKIGKTLKKLGKDNSDDASEVLTSINKHLTNTIRIELTPEDPYNFINRVTSLYDQHNEQYLSDTQKAANQKAAMVQFAKDNQTILGKKYDFSDKSARQIASDVIASVKMGGKKLQRRIIAPDKINVLNLNFKGTSISQTNNVVQDAINFAKADKDFANITLDTFKDEKAVKEIVEKTLFKGFDASQIPDEMRYLYQLSHDELLTGYTKIVKNLVPATLKARGDVQVSIKNGQFIIFSPSTNQAINLSDSLGIEYRNGFMPVLKSGKTRKAIGMSIGADGTLHTSMFDAMNIFYGKSIEKASGTDDTIRKIKHAIGEVRDNANLRSERHGDNLAAIGEGSYKELKKTRQASIANLPAMLRKHLDSMTGYGTSKDKILNDAKQMAAGIGTGLESSVQSIWNKLIDPNSSLQSLDDIRSPEERQMLVDIIAPEVFNRSKRISNSEISNEANIMLHASPFLQDSAYSEDKLMLYHTGESLYKYGNNLSRPVPYSDEASSRYTKKQLTKGMSIYEDASADKNSGTHFKVKGKQISTKGVVDKISGLNTNSIDGFDFDLDAAKAHLASTMIYNDSALGSQDLVDVFTRSTSRQIPLYATMEENLAVIEDVFKINTRGKKSYGLQLLDGQLVNKSDAIFAKAQYGLSEQDIPAKYSGILETVVTREDGTILTKVEKKALFKGAQNKEEVMQILRESNLTIGVQVNPHSATTIKGTVNYGEKMMIHSIVTPAGATKQGAEVFDSVQDKSFQAFRGTALNTSTINYYEQVGILSKSQANVLRQERHVYSKLFFGDDTKLLYNADTVKHKNYGADALQAVIGDDFVVLGTQAEDYFGGTGKGIFKYTRAENMIVRGDTLTEHKKEIVSKALESGSFSQQYAEGLENIIKGSKGGIVLSELAEKYDKRVHIKHRAFAQNSNAALLSNRGIELSGEHSAFIGDNVRAFDDVDIANIARPTGEVGGNIVDSNHIFGAHRINGAYGAKVDLGEEFGPNRYLHMPYSTSVDRVGSSISLTDAQKDFSMLINQWQNYNELKTMGTLRGEIVDGKTQEEIEKAKEKIVSSVQQVKQTIERETTKKGGTLEELNTRYFKDFAYNGKMAPLLPELYNDNYGRLMGNKTLGGARLSDLYEQGHHVAYAESGMDFFEDFLKTVKPEDMDKTVRDLETKGLTVMANRAPVNYTTSMVPVQMYLNKSLGAGQVKITNSLFGLAKGDYDGDLGRIFAPYKYDVARDVLANGVTANTNKAYREMNIKLIADAEKNKIYSDIIGNKLMADLSSETKALMSNDLLEVHRAAVQKSAASLEEFNAAKEALGGGIRFKESSPFLIDNSIDELNNLLANGDASTKANLSTVLSLSERINTSLVNSQKKAIGPTNYALKTVRSALNTMSFGEQDGPLMSNMINALGSVEQLPISGKNASNIDLKMQEKVRDAVNSSLRGNGTKMKAIFTEHASDLSSSLDIAISEAASNYGGAYRESADAIISANRSGNKAAIQRAYEGAASLIADDLNAGLNLMGSRAVDMLNKGSIVGTIDGTTKSSSDDVVSILDSYVKANFDAGGDASISRTVLEGTMDAAKQTAERASYGAMDIAGSANSTIKSLLSGSGAAKVLAAGAIGMAGALMIAGFVGGNPIQPAENHAQETVDEIQTEYGDPQIYQNTQQSTSQQGYVININARSKHGEKHAANAINSALRNHYKTDVNISLNIGNNGGNIDNRKIDELLAGALY